MNVSHGQRYALRAFAIALVLVNLLAMLPAFAASHPCQPAHVEGGADYREGLADHRTLVGSPSGCCEAMHCCPMLPSLPSPGLPLAVNHRHHPYLKVEQPLLLATAIDPPPRSPAS
ncbi:hypothetical protein [uncultured Agrobacterium sp.]|uniref:hypothetical protein n=1 Tax=uncultured Agrobacterium sp. TaxID=157277 RepID=UPI0025F60FB5|nr:hypothetical protein [uncultured Agrobacterium sp.]